MLQQFKDEEQSNDLERPTGRVSYILLPCTLLQHVIQVHQKEVFSVQFVT